MRRCRYIEKFYGMKSQLQKISLRLQVSDHPFLTSPFHAALFVSCMLTRELLRPTGPTSR